MTPGVRTCVAIRPEEFELLFDPSVAQELNLLSHVDFAPAGDGKVPVPTDVAERYDVLVTSWSTAPFPPERLEGERLQLAVHAAGSVRGLFPRSALGSGFRLAQGGASGMAVAVAEMSVTLAMVLLRNVHIHDRGLQSERDWSAGGNGMLGRAVSAQRVGIVGLSRVGKHVARMMRGLGTTQLSAFDPYASADDAAAAGVELMELAELCDTSDVLQVCAPATPQTRHMLGAEQLARLPDGAVLVNAARSALVDQAALLAELQSGRISAGLDVFDAEPLPADSPFYGLKNVVLTPHVAGGTVQARRSQGKTVVSEISRFLRGEPLENEVTDQNYDRLA